MDIQRTGLLAVLGILTYVLFLQWNLFIEADNPASAVSAQIQPSTETPKAGEVPSSSGVTQAPIAPISSNIVADQIIISTSTADMAITLSGGDITQVLLKEFPVSLKNQDQPIPLLDYVSRTYFAQSGLVGADGPDASTDGRPVYKAEQQRYDITEPTDISIQATTDTGLIITKTFSVDPAHYDVKVTHTVQNTSDTAKTVSPFVQLKRDNSADPSIQNSMGMQAFL